MGVATVKKNSINLKSIKIEHFAFIFLIFGIIILYFLSLAGKPEVVSDYSELEDLEGETVVLKGIIIDQDSTSRGELILTILEPNDLESTTKIFIENSNENFTIGDQVQAKGSVLKINDDLYELVVMNEKDIKKIGHWYHYRLTIPELAHRLECTPGEFAYLPVEVSGYIKYEPRMPINSLRLSEDPEDGLYNVKIDVPSEKLITGDFHKGDLVSLNVSVEYNENNFEYKLILKNITLLKPYGEWFVTLSELQEAPFVFEGATINTSGYVYHYETSYNYILLLDTPSTGRWDTNCSIWVDITNLELTHVSLEDNYFISLSGALYYDPQYLDYALMAEELFIV
jgi:hypothetical protein